LAVPVREVLIEGFFPYAYAVMYVAFFASGSAMIYGLFRHLRSYGVGAGEFFSLVVKDVRTKVRRFAEFGLGQRRVLGEAEGGAMHGALFYGFLLLFAYTSLIFIQNDILPLFTPYEFLQGNFYLGLEFLGDAFGAAYMVGLAVAVYRRFVQRPEKLETGREDYLLLGMLIWIGISGFLIEGLRLAIDPTAWAAFSPVGDTISGAFAMIGSSASLAQLYQGFWWAHMLSVMALIAMVPYTKLVHVFTSGFNVALAEVKPMGKLSTPYNLQAMMEKGDFEVPPSVRSTASLPPLKRLALDACTNCGRCQEVCPAHASGRDLSPRVVVQDLGRQMAADEKGDVFARGTIRESELWACTMCNACVAACPVFIDQVDYIAEFRRSLVTENRLDGRKKIFLENVARSGNPFGFAQAERGSWVREEGVPTLAENPGAEYLYWVGCQSSYDPRARKVARAVVKVLRAAGVSFAVLGEEESCTGEPVRRMGEEGRFQELAMKNVETFRKYRVKKVVVHCAHCFNTFKNEYPEFGGEFEVVHHSQLLSALAAEGRLPRGRFGSKVTFHDPCNLGRINGVIEEPREVLASLEGLSLSEMERSKMASFCCGGGGANAWYEVPEKKKIGVIRTEEAKKTGADTLAVACPFCITMFEDALKATGDDGMKVMDIAEIVAASLEGGP
jgi:Fe-S oxidoreductase/nitrate reductase gamma subunit